MSVFDEHRPLSERDPAAYAAEMEMRCRAKLAERARRAERAERAERVERDKQRDAERHRVDRVERDRLRSCWSKVIDACMTSGISTCVRKDPGESMLDPPPWEIINRLAEDRKKAEAEASFRVNAAIAAAITRERSGASAHIESVRQDTQFWKNACNQREEQFQILKKRLSDIEDETAFRETRWRFVFGVAGWGWLSTDDHSYFLPLPGIGWARAR